MSAVLEARPERSEFGRYRHSLWLLTTRDLKVRYSTSFLGYFWSILDPLVMAAIYWVVFTQIFHRGSRVEQLQLAQSHALNLAVNRLDELPIPDPFGVLVAERPDHGSIL